MTPQNHLENSLTKIRAILTEASNRIQALKPGEKITAGALAKEISPRLNMTPAQLTPFLSLLIKGYPGIVSKRGPGGGVEKLSAENQTE